MLKNAITTLLECPLAPDVKDYYSTLSKLITNSRSDVGYFPRTPLSPDYKVRYIKSLLKNYFGKSWNIQNDSREISIVLNTIDLVLQED